MTSSLSRTYPRGKGYRRARARHFSTFTSRASRERKCSSALYAAMILTLAMPFATSLSTWRRGCRGRNHIVQIHHRRFHPIFSLTYFHTLRRKEYLILRAIQTTGTAYAIGMDMMVIMGGGVIGLRKVTGGYWWTRLLLTPFSARARFNRRLSYWTFRPWAKKVHDNTRNEQKCFLYSYWYSVFTSYPLQTNEAIQTQSVLLK